MTNPSHPRIASLDHLDNGAVIRFEDGSSAFFSADMLYRMLPEAKTMPSNSANKDSANTQFFDELPKTEG